MSITRSPCRPAPATETPKPPRNGRRGHLFLVGHGSTRAADDNRALLRHAERLAARAIFDAVDVGLLYGEPSAETVARRLPRDPLYVVPLFMAGGSYPSQRIPALFGLNGCSREGDGPIFCPPVGLHPRLAEIVVARACARADAEGSALRATTLLVVGHGSTKSDASYHATETQAARMRGSDRFGHVVTAYLEQEPELSSVLVSLEGPLVAVGLFAGEGAHACRDVPELLESYESGPLAYLGAIGADPAIADLVLDQVAAADPGFRR